MTLKEYLLAFLFSLSLHTFYEKTLIGPSKISVCIRLRSDIILLLHVFERVM